MMRAECQFAKAGQGLFYNGILVDNKGKCFTFVYDCGTQHSCEVLNNSVLEYQNLIKGKLDLLLISHLHDDHVSHIPTLIDKVSLGTVVLPFVQPNIRLLLAAQLNRRDDALISFYNDPTEYFRYHGAERVYLIHGSDNDDNSDDNETAREPNPNFAPHEIEVWGQEFSEDTTDTLDSKYMELKQFRGTANIYVPHYAWEFKTLNPIPEHLKHNFDTEINKICEDNNNDFHLILSNELLIRRLREIYEENVSGKFNDTSLLVCSRPCTRGYIVDNNLLRLYGYCYCDSDDCKKFIGYVQKYGHIDTLLMGDIETMSKKIVKRIKSCYFKNNPCYVPRIMQLPHHGATDCSDILCHKACYPYCGCCITTLVASYGLTNTYGHPNFQYLFDLLDISRLQTELVNERCDFSYTVFFG